MHIYANIIGFVQANKKVLQEQEHFTSNSYITRDGRIEGHFGPKKHY